jgi:hypothetical protein
MPSRAWTATARVRVSPLSASLPFAPEHERVGVAAGEITAADIEAVYDTSKHPDVVKAESPEDKQRISRRVPPKTPGAAARGARGGEVRTDPARASCLVSR